MRTAEYVRLCGRALVTLGYGHNHGGGLNCAQLLLGEPVANCRVRDRAGGAVVVRSASSGANGVTLLMAQTGHQASSRSERHFQDALPLLRAPGQRVRPSGVASPAGTRGHQKVCSYDYGKDAERPSRNTGAIL